MRRHQVRDQLPHNDYETYFKHMWYDGWIEAEWESIRESEVQGNKFTLEEAENRSHDEFRVTYPYFEKLMTAGIEAEEAWQLIIDAHDTTLYYPDLPDGADDVWDNALYEREDAYDDLETYWSNLWVKIENIFHVEDDE